MSGKHLWRCLLKNRNTFSKVPRRNFSCKIPASCDGVRNFSSDEKDGNVFTSGLTDIDIPNVSVTDYVFEHFSEWPDRVATECTISGRKYTHHQLLTKSRNLSRALRKKLNLTKGDVVAILLPNIPEFPIAAYGILKAGLVVTTINPLYSPAEISKQLLDSSTKAIITLSDFTKLAEASNQLAKKKLPIISISSQPNQTTPQGTINFTELTDQVVDLPDLTDISPDDLAFLPYSSGTTGLPKGVQLTHRNIVANLCQLDHPALGIVTKTTQDHQDVIPTVLPKFHIYGFTVNTSHSLRRGAKLLTMPKFSPELYISALRKHKPNVLFLAPPLAIFLAAHPAVTKEDLSSITRIISGAAPLGALDEQKLLQKAGKYIEIFQGYGMTETSPLVACTRKGIESAGSIGKPAPNTLLKLVSIDDPNAQPLGLNQTGELYVKGPQVMQCYHNRAEETKNAFRNGWLRTGDIAYCNDKGLLFITDRLKELIKVKGYQVAPAELEEVIRDFPNVVDAAVIGIPHETYGEVPRAYVVSKPGSDVDCDKLNEYVKSKVASYKNLVGGIQRVEDIPKNATGKIMRKELRLQFEKTGK